MGLKDMLKMIPSAMLPPNIKLLLEDGGLLDKIPGMVAKTMKPNEMMGTFGTADGLSINSYKGEWVKNADNSITFFPREVVTLDSMLMDKKDLFEEKDLKMLESIQQKP